MHLIKLIASGRKRSPDIIFIKRLLLHLLLHNQTGIPVHVILNKAVKILRLWLEIFLRFEIQFVLTRADRFGGKGPLEHEH